MCRVTICLQFGAIRTDPLNRLAKLLAPVTGTEQYTSVEDNAFEAWIVSELAALPGVLAVTLGGSRAQGTHRPDATGTTRCTTGAPSTRGLFGPRAGPAKSQRSAVGAGAS